MGRRSPWADDLSVQPTAFSLSLLLAGIAISTTTTLCIARFPKRSKQKPSIMSPPNKIAENSDTSASPLPPPATLITTSETSLTMPRLPAVESEAGCKEDDAPTQMKGLPLPPAMQLSATYSSNNLMTKSASTRSLRKTVSKKMRKSLSSATTKRESIEGRSNHRKKKEKLRHEDNIWKKTIILGGKCKVPDEGDEDVINVYDGKGNRISAYHPRTPTSISFSMQNSHLDRTAIPFLDRDKGIIKEEEEEEEEFS